MRSGKQLLAHSKLFSYDNSFKSWFEIILTLTLSALFLTVAFYESLPLIVRILSSFVCGLLYVRLFVIYHDYEHRAILQNSVLAHGIMALIGIYLLAPETIWRRSHEHHHNHNSKLTLGGIGSFPLVSKKYFLSLPRHKQKLYLVNRHPMTVLFGYFTLFIYWLNFKSFVQSPGRHIDSLIALAFHFMMSVVVLYYFGIVTLILGWSFPFFLSFGIGSYLFYCQHNFPGALFHESNEWAYDKAAIQSTSRMVMGSVMNWFTGNIGYHHVHHLNSRIPFYRLREAMKSMPELDGVPTTSWKPAEMFRCLQLKMWDSELGKMITMKEFKTSQAT